MSSVTYKTCDHMILEPLRIVMINMVGQMYKLDGSRLDISLDKIFKKFKKTENIIGIKLKGETKGDVVDKNTKKKKNLASLKIFNPEKCSYTLYSNKKMYTSQLTYNFKYIDMFKLSELIRTKYKVNALYNPVEYFALKVYYQYKNCTERNRATIIMYKSGKCAINGTNHRWKIREVYKWFNKILFDNHKDLSVMN